MFQFNCSVSPLLWRRERQDHPRDHEVEEEHRVHHQWLAVGRLAVGEEGRGGEDGPDEGHQHNHQPYGKAGRPRATEQDNPAHDHGCRQRHDAVSQHTQALEEGDGPAQQFGVEGDDDGAEPDDDEDLGRGISVLVLSQIHFSVKCFIVSTTHWDSKTCSSLKWHFNRNEHQFGGTCRLLSVKSSQLLPLERPPCWHQIEVFKSICPIDQHLVTGFV